MDLKKIANYIAYISLGYLIAFQTLNQVIVLAEYFPSIVIILLQFLSKSCEVLVLFSIIYKFFEKGISKKILLTFFGITTVFLATFVFFPDNIPFFKEYSIGFYMVKSLMAIFLIFSYDFDYKKLAKMLSVISIILGILLIYVANNFPLIQIVSLNGLNETVKMNYMDFGLAMLLPSTVLLYSAYFYKSWIFGIFGVLFSLNVVILANRGSMLCIIIFLLGFLFFKWRKYEMKKRIFFAVAVSSIFIVVYEFKDKILILLNTLLVNNGYYSRTLDMLVSGNGSNDSGRALIYNIVEESIKKNWLFGNGIMGDRKVLKDALLQSTYSHNIILEILCSFGLIFGTILIIYAVYVIIFKLLFNNSLKEDVFLWLFLLMSIGLIPLFTSLSLFRWPLFFIFFSVLGKESSKNYEKKNLYN